MSSGSEIERNPSAGARRHLDRAYRHDEREELEAALVECEAALQIAGDWAEAHNLHGIILEGLGRRPEALAAYAEAIRLDLVFEEAQENLAELEAELAGEGSASPGPDGGLLALEPEPPEGTAALPGAPALAPRSEHAPACDTCGRQDETLREVFYPYIVSFLIVTFRRGYVGRWCRRHRDLRLSLASLITVTVGWLGVPWTRFVKSSNGRCACGNDAALYDNCTTFQIPILSGKPLTCQVQEPLERIHEHNRRARI